MERRQPWQHILDIESWFIRGGGQISPSVEIHHGDDSMGYQLRLRRGHFLELPASVVECPHQLTISVLNVQEASSPWPKAFLERWATNPEVLTRFYLMEQLYLQDRSFWWPYLKMLPQPEEPSQLKTPLWWNGEELLWIRGTNIDGARKSREKEWREQYEEGVKILSYHKADPARIRSSWIVYKWAATILTSRSFREDALRNRQLPPGSVRWFGVGFPVLIPVFDIANHDPRASVSWRWGTHFSTLVMLAEHRHDIGQEIFNNYGPKSNEELLMGYGFTIQDNPPSSYQVSIRFLPGQYNKIQEELIRRELMYRPQCVAPRFESRLFDLYVETLVSPFSLMDANLLDNLGLFLANDRELRTLKNESSRMWIPTSDSIVPVTRLKVAIIKTLLMVIHNHHDRLSSHNHRVPVATPTVIQAHAARYRAEQLDILTRLQTGLMQYQATQIVEKGLVLTLETIVRDSPAEINLPLRRIYEKCFTVSDGKLGPKPWHGDTPSEVANRVKEFGLGDLFFTVYICLMHDKVHHEDFNVQHSPSTSPKEKTAKSDKSPPWASDEVRAGMFQKELQKEVEEDHLRKDASTQYSPPQNAAEAKAGSTTTENLFRHLFNVYCPPPCDPHTNCRQVNCCRRWSEASMQNPKEAGAALHPPPPKGEESGEPSNAAAKPLSWQEILNPTGTDGNQADAGRGRQQTPIPTTQPAPQSTVWRLEANARQKHGKVAEDGSSPSAAKQEAEAQKLAQSYHQHLHTVGDPLLPWMSERWTVGLLRWGYGVYVAERVVLSGMDGRPGMQGETGDVAVLVLEDCAEVAESDDEYDSEGLSMTGWGAYS